jgi:hypothetical protein
LAGPLCGFRQLICWSRRLNEEAFAPPAAARVGRFTLQETPNIFTFLLLDQDDGRVWQVQWSNDADKRGVMRQLSDPIR